MGRDNMTNKLLKPM